MALCLKLWRLLGGKGIQWTLGLCIPSEDAWEITVPAGEGSPLRLVRLILIFNGGNVPAYKSVRKHLKVQCNMWKSKSWMVVDNEKKLAGKSD